MNQGEYRYSDASVEAEKIALARQSDIAIRQSCVDWNKRSMQIGWHAAFLKNNKLFKYIGFADEIAYRDSLKIGRSTWHRMIALANGFPNLDEETFTKMSANNAELLIEHVSEKERDADQYIEMASTLTTGEFELRLLGRRSEVESVPVDEVRVPFKINMHQGRKEAIEEGIHEFQKLHGIQDASQALELIVAESRDKKTIMGFLNESLPKLKKAIELASDQELDPESALLSVQEILSDYITGMAEALEVA